LIFFSSVGAFMVHANSEKFCATACHEMTYLAAEYKDSVHDKNRTGVRAACNDCHVPHDNFINKYYFKAKDGLRHATIFTLRNEPQVIRILEAGINVVQDNCIRCHEQQMSCMPCHSKFNDSGDEYTMSNSEFAEYHSDRLCWECHREVPHGRVNSISSVPYARVPVPGSPVPEWMKSSWQSAVGSHQEENTQD